MTLKFNIKPYFDDFETPTGVGELSPKEKYHKILFRPSHAVQARELTQLQSILQNQVTSVGNHLFKEGSMVIPGHVSASTKVDFIKLQSRGNVSDLSVLIGRTIEASNISSGTTSSLQAIVVAVAPAVGTELDTIYVQYQRSGDSDNEKKFTADEYIKTLASTGQSSFLLQTAAVSTTPIGLGSVAFLESGIYFIKGHFVVVQKDQIILEKYGQKPTYDIGLKITESIITSAEDTTLTDNANGTQNYAAPGAHRHQITTELIIQNIGIDSAGTDDEFALLIQIDEGVIIKQVRATSYSVIEETLARRTFDESGNYTVRHFDIDVKQNPLTDTMLIAGLDPSKAYVQGYEIETLSTISVDLKKARETALFESAAFPIQIGNYIDVTNVLGVPDISDFSLITISGAVYNASQPVSNVIGNVRCRSFEKIQNGATQADHIYRLYLFAVNITALGRTSFSDAKSFISTSRTPDFFANIALAPQEAAVLKQVGRNSMVYPLPFDRVKTCNSDLSGVDVNGFNYVYDTIRLFSGQTVAANQVIFSTISDENFNGFSSKWTLVQDDDGVILPIGSGDINLTNNATGGTGSTRVTINVSAYGVPNGKKLSLIASTRRTLREKTKSLVSSGSVPNESLIKISNPTNDMRLDHADGYRLLSVYMSPDLNTEANSSHQNVTEYYRLDDGQRDNFYDLARCQLKAGSPFRATGQLEIKFNYFSHSIGDFFSVDSYPVDYELIPKFNSTNTGKTIELRSAIDFRPRVGDNGSNFDSSTTGALTATCPDPNSTFTTDIQYYLSRLDKIVLDSKGEFSVIEGAPSLDPELPDSPKESMVLYHVLVPAYTLDASEVETALVDNKRYTMRDIGRLEKRINNIEYYTSLSLLESEASNKPIQDADGTFRTKSGFVVDSFNTHSVGNVVSPDYKASIDRLNHTLRPLFVEKNVKLRPALGNVLGASTHIVKTGDLITLPFTPVTLFNQNKASATINVNPYQVFEWTGTIELSPSQDEWRDTINRPRITVNQDGVYDAMLAIIDATDAMGTTWNSWETNWTGIETSETSVINTLGHTRGGQATATNVHNNASDIVTTTTTTELRQTRTGIETTLTPSTLTTNLGDRVVEINFAPFIRSRLVSFRATNLKPLTKMYAFFDGVAISNWVRSNDVYVDFTGSDAEIEAQMLLNYNDGATPPVALPGGTGDLEHPQGKLDIITDESGSITGSFWIPNTELHRFKTGSRVFRLSDDQNNMTMFESTSAATQYIAKGLIETKENVTISTRVPMLNQNQVFDDRTVVDTSVQAATRWWDPLAQSFLLDAEKQPYGACLTSVDLYFHTKSETLPVTLQLREMNQGIPTAVVVPFSNVTLNPNDVNVVDLTQGPPDSNISTTFEFKSPIYLQSGREYCFVVMSNSIDYECWYAGIGENDFESGKRISKQPYAGVLFTSQNASTWSADQNKDLKFKMNRAKFDNKKPDGTDNKGTLILQESTLPVVRLRNNPIRTKVGSTNIRVFQKNHHFMDLKNNSISYVTISGITGTVNGIPNAELNGQHQVFNVEQDSYEIGLNSNSTITTNATSSGISGGNNIYATENVMFNTAHTAVQSMNFPVTKSSWGVKMLEGVSLGDQTSAPYQNRVEPFSPIVINRNFHVDNPKVIAGPGNGPLQPSFTLQGILSSDSDYVSPIIDLERCSLICVQNRIDNVTGITETFDLQGLWDNSKTYEVGQIVTFNASSYKAVESHTGKEPLSVGNLDVWVAVSNVGLQVFELLVAPISIVEEDGTSNVEARNLTVFVDDVERTDYVLTEETANDGLRILTFNSPINPTSGVVKVDVIYQPGQISGKNIVHDYVPDTKNGASGLAKYLTKNIQLKDIADEIRVLLDVNRPSNAFVDLYYRTCTDGTEIDSRAWRLAEPVDDDIPFSDNTVDFREVEYQITPGDFSVFALKIVLRSSNSSRVPQCKDLRAIAVKK